MVAPSITEDWPDHRIKRGQCAGKLGESDHNQFGQGVRRAVEGLQSSVYSCAGMVMTDVPYARIIVRVNAFLPSCEARLTMSGE
jgi:hypothetical protein